MNKNIAAQSFHSFRNNALPAASLRPLFYSYVVWRARNGNDKINISIRHTHFGLLITNYTLESLATSIAKSTEILYDATLVRLFIIHRKRSKECLHFVSYTRAQAQGIHTRDKFRFEFCCFI